MPALLQIVTEKDLKAFASGSVDEDTAWAVEALMAEDESVRSTVEEISGRKSGLLEGPSSWFRGSER